MCGYDVYYVGSLGSVSPLCWHSGCKGEGKGQWGDAGRAWCSLAPSGRLPAPARPPTERLPPVSPTPAAPQKAHLNQVRKGAR